MKSALDVARASAGKQSICINLSQAADFSLRPRDRTVSIARMSSHAIYLIPIALQGALTNSKLERYAYIMRRSQGR